MKRWWTAWVASFLVGCSPGEADGPPWLGLSEDSTTEPDETAAVDDSVCAEGVAALDLGWGVRTFHAIDPELTVPLIDGPLTGWYLPLALRTHHVGRLVQLELEVFDRTGRQVANLVGNVGTDLDEDCVAEILDLHLYPEIVSDPVWQPQVGAGGEVELGLRGRVEDLDGNVAMSWAMVRVMIPSELMDTGLR